MRVPFQIISNCQTPIANRCLNYKGSPPPGLSGPDSLISSAEDCVAKFTSLVIARDYSVCEVFQKEVFRVSPRFETPSYKYYLTMIKHSFSPKMYRKNFENRFTNINLMSKKVFE